MFPIRSLGARIALVATLAAITCALSATGASAITAAPQQFDNSTAIAIAQDGPATPYPSTIDVSGAPTSGYQVSVILHGFTKTRYTDTHLLLQAPDGSYTTLMEMSGLGNVSNADVTFADGYPALADNSGDLSTGTYGPTENSGLIEFASPAPPPPNDSWRYGASLTQVEQGDPNGTWKLYEDDSYGLSSGEIAGGWSLVIAPDTTPPAIDISVPSDGQQVSKDSHPAATFSCTDNVSLSSCSADVDGTPIASGDDLPTDSFGTHTLTVTATDTAGNTTTTHHDYSVVADSTKPTAAITGLTDGAHVVQNEHVDAGFGCDDDVAVQSCTADVDGQSLSATDPLPTGSIGPHTFTVHAVDTSGNASDTSISYTVDPPQAGLTYGSRGPITINDNAPASPYPSTLDVSGAPTGNYRVKVVLHGFSHASFRDTQLLLQAPDGTATALLQENDDNSGQAADVDLTFADGAPAIANQGDLSSGTYAPTEQGYFDVPFASPAPSATGAWGAYGASLAAVSNGDPNGTWKLYVEDVDQPNGGQIAGGWDLVITDGGTAVPTATTRASIAPGSRTVGQTLTADRGAWNGSPAGYRYSWQRCDTHGANCTEITSADATDGDNTYTLTNDDVASRIKVKVIATNAGGEGVSWSDATAVVGVPTATVRPVVSGTLQPGQTLTTTDGTWDPTPTGIAHAWQRCDANGANCVAITSPDATDGDSTYTLTSDDAGHRIRAQVTATNAAGSGVSTSNATGMVGSPVATARPVIHGTAEPGQALTATTGTWDPPATGYSYAWQRCDANGANCVTITSADATDGDSSYTLTSDDAAHRIRVKVTATNDAGSGGSTSDATAPVGVPIATVRPHVSGGTLVGQTLTTTDGTWDPAATAPLGYAWQRCNPQGGSCVTITSPDATDGDNSYTLTSDDAGYRIRARVTATNDAGSNTSASDASSTVQAAS